LDRALAQLRAAATQAGGLCFARIGLPDGSTQLIAVAHVMPAASHAMNADEAFTVASPASAGHAADPQAIVGPIAEALDAYHTPDVLQDNPLTRLLDLSRFAQPNDRHNPDGHALRRALDSAMRAIERRPVKRAGRLAHYFRLRYVERATQLEAAGSLDRSERTANRIKQELIEELSRELIRQQAV
jgi:hypothetical protein